jgi:hypothetical protein
MKKITLAALSLLAFGLASAQAELIVAVTSDNRLLFFDSASPGNITKVVRITGLQAGETLIGIDFRPANGSLYGLATSGRGYQIDISSGKALAGVPTVALNGTRFGFDFNPVPDRVRVTSDADQNLRVNPNDGSLTATDGTLAYASGDANSGANPNVVASGYTNSFAGAMATTLYNIDSNLDILVTQNPPNAGTLNTVGPLGVNTTDNVGFDISPLTGMAYASLTVGATTQLYTINLASGAASLVGPIASAGTLGTGTVTGLAAFGTTRTRIYNVSSRARVNVGEDALISGFMTRGGVPTTMLGRALGPSLSSAGVASPLQDPILEVFDGNGVLIAANDDWRSSDQAAEIMATGLAPTDNRESAVFGTLLPGSYTLVVRGKGSSTGIAVGEIYDLSR